MRRKIVFIAHRLGMFRRSRHFTHPHKLSSSSSLQLLFSGSMLGKQHLLRGCHWTCTKRQPKQAALIRRSYWWDCTGDCEQWGSLNVKIIFQKFHKLMRCAAKYFDLADVMESVDGRKGAMENFVKRSLLRFCRLFLNFREIRIEKSQQKFFLARSLKLFLHWQSRFDTERSLST